MAYAELVEEAKGLSESSVSEVIDFIKFLKAKEEPKNISGIKFDLLKGGLKYMADDFDAPLDCFREYM